MNARQSLKKWQKIFNLSHWKIKVRVVSENDNPEMEGMNGYVELHALDKEADVFVNVTEEDPEPIVVHELLHVLLMDNFRTFINSIGTDGDSYDLFEYCGETLVRDLSKAFDGRHDANPTGTIGYS